MKKIILLAFVSLVPFLVNASELGGFTTHTINPSVFDVLLGKTDFGGDYDTEVSSTERITAEEYDGIVLKLKAINDILFPADCDDGSVLVWDADVSSWECGASESGGGSSSDAWIVDEDNMYANVSGNVGVGVSDPLAKLHVVSDTANPIRLEADITNTTGSTQIDIFNDDATRWALGVNSSAHPTHPGDGYLWGYQAEDFRFGVQGTEILKLGADGTISIPSLGECGTLYTDSDGVLTCGSGGSGTDVVCSEEGEVLKWMNTAEEGDPQVYGWVCAVDESSYASEALSLGFCVVSDGNMPNTQWIAGSGPVFRKTDDESDPMKPARFFPDKNLYDGSDCALSCADGYSWDVDRGSCVLPKRMCGEGEFLVGFDGMGNVVCESVREMTSYMTFIDSLGACSSVSDIQVMCMGPPKMPMPYPNPTPEYPDPMRDPRNCGNPLDIAFFTQDDRDSKMYRVLSVGNDCWMAENLNFDPGGGSRLCDPDSGAPNGNCTLGGLYSFETILGNNVNTDDFDFTCGQNGCYRGSGNPKSAVAPVRGICMQGWHIPTKSEFQGLSGYLQTESATVERFGVNEDGGYAYYDTINNPAGWQFWDFSDKYWAAYRNEWTDTNNDRLIELQYLETEDDNFSLESLMTSFSQLGSNDPDNYAYALRCVKDRSNTQYECSGTLPQGAEYWDWSDGQTPTTPNESKRHIFNYAANYTQDANRFDLRCDWKCKHGEYGYYYDSNVGQCVSNTPFCNRPDDTVFLDPQGEWNDNGEWRRMQPGINYTNVQTRSLSGTGQPLSCQTRCFDGYDLTQNGCVERQPMQNRFGCGWLPPNANWVRDGRYTTPNERRWKPFYDPDNDDDDACAYYCTGSTEFTGNNTLGCR